MSENALEPIRDTVKEMCARADTGETITVTAHFLRAVAGVLGDAASIIRLRQFQGRPLPERSSRVQHAMNVVWAWREQGKV